MDKQGLSMFAYVSVDCCLGMVAVEGLEPRHAAYESAALPTELHRHLFCAS